ncbi:DUF6225 family protein [Nonomuraea sp. NPDC050394]|uniref:DUF6225 family protein n=1 Tax=Nonomuraea sp. NPDC050394 TaxID=3364363 RepID=UPI0037A790CB
MTEQQHDYAHTTVVPWNTITDMKGRPAWTAGQLRAAIAHLDDDAPILVTVATDKDDVADEQIITEAGPGYVDWGDGYGLETSSLFTLNCHWPSETQLLVRPDRPRRRS